MRLLSLLEDVLEGAKTLRNVADFFGNISFRKDRPEDWDSRFQGVRRHQVRHSSSADAKIWQCELDPSGNNLYRTYTLVVVRILRLLMSDHRWWNLSSLGNG